MERRLGEFNNNYTGPDVFFVWNGHTERWEIWSELRGVSHPDALNEQYDSDRWFSDRSCWGRKLVSWAHRDEQFLDVGYASLNEGVFDALRQADTWSDRLWYEEHVDEPGFAAERATMAARSETIREGAAYFRKYDRTLVAPHGGSQRAAWRHRIR